MQNPYDKYSKNQNKVVKKTRIQSQSQSQPQRKKKRVGKRTSSSSKPLITLILAGMVSSFYIFAYTEEVIDLFSNIKIGVPLVFAKDSAKSAGKNSKKEEKVASNSSFSGSVLETDVKKMTMKNASVFEALEKKKIELEKKERELARLDEDLQKQKEEIEGQLKELNRMRRDISSVLDKKVTADKESVDKLVGVYSNMKPGNAANIISNINEELAIKVLRKMKKQNAAAILNFIEPKKARTLSEKYAGLKKR